MNDIRNGPNTISIIIGTIKSTDIIDILFGNLFICSLTPKTCFSLRNSIWEYIVSIILFPNIFVCVMFKIILFIVSDGILFFVSSIASISDLPNLT